MKILSPEERLFKERKKRQKKKKNHKIQNFHVLPENSKVYS